MIFLIISLTFSKLVTLFTYLSFTKRVTLQSVNNSPTNSKSLFVSIRLNPLVQIDKSDGCQQQSTRLSIDDDDELIQSDITSIVASKFCNNDTIELRLDQDVEYDNELTNENIN